MSPTELEGMLFTHPAVLDVGVVGLPDETAVSKPKAFVVKKPDADVTETELCEYLAGNCGGLYLLAKKDQQMSYPIYHS